MDASIRRRTAFGMLTDLAPPSGGEVDSVTALLPELTDLVSPEAQGRCIRIWAAAIRAGSWPDPRLAPTLPGVPIGPDTNLVAHTRRVMRACRDVGHAIAHGEIRPDLDILLEAAALHDVAKLVEYEPAQGHGFVLSAVGRSLPHAAIGAQWAIAVGAPESVARAIYVHTPAVAATPDSIEAIILFAVDQVDADASRLGAGVPPSAKRALLGGATAR